jgi:hypothetical protein
VNLCRAHHIGSGHCLPQPASGHAEQQDDGGARQVPSGSHWGKWLAKIQVRAGNVSLVNVHEGHRPGANRTRDYRRTASLRRTLDTIRPRQA